MITEKLANYNLNIPSLQKSLYFSIRDCVLIAIIMYLYKRNLWNKLQKRKECIKVYKYKNINKNNINICQST